MKLLLVSAAITGKAVEEVSSLNQTPQQVSTSIRMDHVGILSLEKFTGK